MWEKVIASNYNLSRLKDYEVMDLVKFMKTDLIVYRISKDQLNVFDCNKKTFVVDYFTFDMNAPNFDNLVVRMKSMGY